MLDQITRAKVDQITLNQRPYSLWASSVRIKYNSTRWFEHSSEQKSCIIFSKLNDH